MFTKHVVLVEKLTTVNLQPAGSTLKHTKCPVVTSTVDVTVTFNCEISKFAERPHSPELGVQNYFLLPVWADTSAWQGLDLVQSTKFKYEDIVIIIYHHIELA